MCIRDSDNIVKDAKIVTLLGGDDVTANYDISYAKGTLTVTDKSVDVDDVVTKTHDDNKTYKLGDTVTFDISVKNIYDEVKTITIVEQMCIRDRSHSTDRRGGNCARVYFPWLG